MNMNNHFVLLIYFVFIFIFNLFNFGFFFGGGVFSLACLVSSVNPSLTVNEMFGQIGSE